uniref:Uncharacterized protein n=1 Tax=Brassica oleracea TaxID=3712 RepID=A0A3P6DV20_BRAOL|nr:unnamed protein product [Brassica oleracea]
MLASIFENLRMDEEETVAQFSAKLCDISNDFFCAWEAVQGQEAGENAEEVIVVEV